jgi:hypothetical protein
MATKRVLLLATITYFILATSLFLVAPQLARAADGTSSDDSCKIGTSKEEKKAAIRVAIPLPGVTQKVVITKELEPGVYGPEAPAEEYWAVKNLSCYLSGFYRYFAGVAGILATVMIMYGGIQYVISFGNPGRLQTAKDTIFSAMVGLVITLGSYIILFTINPNLVTLKLPETAPIQTIFVDMPRCNADTDLAYDDDGNLVDHNDMRFADYITCNKRGKTPTGAECLWTGCALGQGCVRGSDENPRDWSTYHCAEPGAACRLFQSSGNDETIESICPQYSYDDSLRPELSGRCLFTGFPNLCTGVSEGCRFYEQLTCETGWERASCAECNSRLNTNPDADEFAGCKFNFGYRGAGFACTLNSIDGEGLPSDSYSTCSDNSTVYFLDKGNYDAQRNKQTYSSICCKQSNANNYKFKCVPPGYWENYFSNP